MDDKISPENAASAGKCPVAHGGLLADRNSLRRAIVLNEILGPPRGSQSL